MCFQKFRIHLSTSPDTFLDLNDLMTLFFWEFFVFTLQHCFGCSFLHVTCNLAYIRQWESLDQIIYFMHIHNIYTIDRFHKHTHTHTHTHIYIYIFTIKFTFILTIKFLSYKLVVLPTLNQVLPQVYKDCTIEMTNPFRLDFAHK